MIYLFSDFGPGGPYQGQMEAAIKRRLPGAVVVNLMEDAPRFRPCAAAYLLAALSEQMEHDAIVVAVVDPGVGSDRQPLLLQADERYFLGPDNGLLARVAATAGVARSWRLDWREGPLSASFHGRDLFAPAAAVLASGRPLSSTPLPIDAMEGLDWPANLPEIIYLDAYGNGWTGIAGENLTTNAILVVNGHEVRYQETFAKSSGGQGFWYRNSSGLVEIAVNQGSAAERLGLELAMPVSAIAD